MQVSAASNPSTASQLKDKTEAQFSTDAFLTLLVTQLRSQNPLEPMNPNEFVAQLAQFNTLSQLIEIRQILERANADPPAAGNGETSPVPGFGPA